MKSHTVVVLRGAVLALDDVMQFAKAVQIPLVAYSSKDSTGLRSSVSDAEDPAAAELISDALYSLSELLPMSASPLRAAILELLATHTKSPT